MRVKYCAAPCGSGKTHQIVNRACGLVRQLEKVLILQPTRELIDRTVKEELETRPSPVPFRVFHRGTVGDGKVAKALSDYFQDDPDLPEIVFATHQVLPHITHFANKGDWHLHVDEAMQAVKYRQHRIPRTHELLTEHLLVTPVGSTFGEVMVRGGNALGQIAKNRDEDEILETLSETSRILGNRHWRTFVNLEQFDRLRRGEGKVLAFHSVLKPEILDGFGSVFMAGANFEDSEIYKLWGEAGIKFEPDTKFAEGLRYAQHPNGGQVTICYATGRQWSKKRREAQEGEGGLTVQDRIVQATKEIFSSRRFLWHANKSVDANTFDALGERLPHKPHGLNAFSGIDNIVFLSSLNPPTDHFRFLESRGLNGGEVRACTYYAEAYQAVMRTSLRDPNNQNPKLIIVPDRGAAEYLHDVFPGSKIEKIETGLNDEPPKRKGRPKKHGSNRERLAQQRQKAREQKLRLLADQLNLNSPDTIEKEDCGGNGRKSRAEKGITLYTNFGSPLLAATIYLSKHTPTPAAYVSGDTDGFIEEFLRVSHGRQTKAKEANYLFSPAIFDPDRFPDKKRGDGNIAYLRNIVMDFEKGVLRPEELPNIFPGLRMVLMNTYNHSVDKPRFRVFIPTTENMTTEVYGLIYNCLAAKLEDAGYSVDRRTKRRKEPGPQSNTRPSGLDWSTRLPTSLFYAPCQAQNPEDSFFIDRSEEPRSLLSPSVWLKNISVPLQPDFEPLPDFVNDEPNEALVRAAVAVWRDSKGQKGRGDEMFFGLALGLRRAEMSLSQIEGTLRSEAQFARSPGERQSQIPSIMSSLRRYPARNVKTGD